MKKKILIPVVAVAVVGVLAGFNALRGGSKAAPEVSVVPLHATDLVSSITATGMVQSENSVNVYSTLNLPIETVQVEVGDVVAEGDVLVELDTTDLEASIAQQKAAIAAQQKKAQHNLAVAKNELETSKFNKEGNYDANLLAAQNAVKAAEAAQRKAQIDLNNAKKDRRELRDDTYDYDLILSNGQTQDDLLEEAHRKIVALEIALEEADQQLENAKANLRAAEMAHKEALIQQKSAIEAAELNTDFTDSWIAVQKLEGDLQKGVIKAPVAGTVTAVFAKEGAISSGILVVIEDAQALKIVTKIKEYDLPRVEIGHSVTIKADGAGEEEEYEGTIAKIAPTSLKTEAGTQVDTTDAEFATEVSVLTKPNKLRIGMNARLNILTDERKGAFALPYDSILTTADGQDAVLVARPQPDGTYIAEQVVITTGLETDFSVEILSPDLKEGDLIISDITIAPGTVVALPAEAATSAVSEPSATEAESTDSSAAGDDASAAVSAEESAAEGSEE